MVASMDLDLNEGDSSKSSSMLQSLGVFKHSLVVSRESVMQQVP